MQSHTVSGNQHVRRRRQDMTHAKDWHYVTSDFVTEQNGAYKPVILNCVLWFLQPVETKDGIHDVIFREADDLHVISISAYHSG